MIKKWELLESEVVFQSPFISLFKEKLKRSDGQVVDSFFSIKRKDAVFVVALTTDNKIPLVFQYKNGVKEVIWEIPAGFIEPDEQPEEAAKRELSEETGFASAELIFLGKFTPNSGISDSRNFLFLALQAEKVKEQNLDGNEEIEVQLFDLPKLIADIRDRKSIFVDTQSQLSLLLVWEYLKK